MCFIMLRKKLHIRHKCILISYSFICRGIPKKKGKGKYFVKFSYEMAVLHINSLLITELSL